MKVIFALIFIVMVFSGFKFIRPGSKVNEVRNIKSEISQTDSITVHTTKTGKTIIVRESHPEGLSTSTIEITSDLRENNPVIVEKSDPVFVTEMTDLDNDGFNELFIITKSAGSGGSGNVIAFASDKDRRLVKIEIPPIADEEYEEGGKLEGYMGHDSFYFENGMLIREFPVYKSNDTNITPSGGIKSVYYVYKNFKLEFLKVIQKDPSVV